MPTAASPSFPRYKPKSRNSRLTIDLLPATRELIAAHHPDTPVRSEIPGRATPIDTGAIERLLGFRATRRLELPTG